MIFDSGLINFMVWVFILEVIYTIVLIYCGRKILKLDDDVMSLQASVMILREQNRELSSRLKKYETR